MPAPNAQQDIQQIPLKVVGGTHFGRYAKISNEQTWNFIVSDEWLVPYAGYKNVLTIAPDVSGRGIYSSYRESMLIAVYGTFIYRINPTGTHQQDGTPNFTFALIGTMYTAEGDVYITENNNGQIVLTDGTYVYVYNYTPDIPADDVFRSSNPSSVNPFSFPFSNPGYCSFQNANVLIACMQTTTWVISGESGSPAVIPDATVWPNDAAHVGALQTKPDFVQAPVPVPGGANNMLLLGRNVAEMWQFTGAALFPYQRNSTFNSDYGCINAATVASLGDVIVWIGVNEQSGPVLMVYKGNRIEQISTDGIDFEMGNLSNPQDCTGFLYQQDGHLIYQFTFPLDNISYAYDFETNLFFNVSDENLNYHIARQIVYFNNTYYFVSLNGGNLYEFDTKFPFAQYSSDNIQDIPRIRITPPFRLPTQRYFIVKSLGFTLENGQPNLTTEIPLYAVPLINIAAENSTLIAAEDGTLVSAEVEFIDYSDSIVLASNVVYLSISRDGGENFGSSLGQPMNPTGVRKSRFIYQRLGQANDFTAQLRFVGKSRYVVADGLLEIWQ